MKTAAPLLFLFIPFSAIAEDFQAEFPVTAATIYPQGAMLNRQASVTVPSGAHTIDVLLNPLSIPQNDARLRVSGATLENIKLRRIGQQDPSEFYTAEQSQTVAALDAIEDQLTRLTNTLQESNSQLKGLLTQQKFIENMQHNSDGTQSFEDLQNVIRVIPALLSENATAQKRIRQDIQTTQRDIADAQEEQKKLNHLLAYFPLPNADWPVATISVFAKTQSTVTISALEFTPAAGWSVSYDVQLDEDKSQLRFERSANISQTTQERWNDVRVVLSSARPFQKLTPEIPHKDVVALIKDNPRLSKSLGREIELAEMAAPSMDTFVITTTAPSAIAGTFDGVAVEYRLENKISISSQLDIAQYVDLPTVAWEAVVDRYASPRHNTHAFVRATVTNTSGEPLLTENARTFRDGNLMGNQRFNFLAAGAETEMFFGPDQSLPLTMTFLSEMSGDTGFISKSNTRQEIMQFDIQNIGTEAQDVTLAYALPISEDEDVQVRANARPRPDVEDVDGVKGRSEWTGSIAPGETQTYSLDVQVTWPEGSEIHWNP